MGRSLLLLVLTGCAERVCALGEVPIVDRTGRLSGDERRALVSWLEDWEGLTTRSVCLSRVEVAEQIDPHDPAIRGRSRPGAGVIELELGFLSRRLVFHELCHVVDHLADARPELFPADSVPQVDTYTSETSRRREAFARACEGGPFRYGAFQRALALSDPRSDASRYLHEVLWDGAVDRLEVDAAQGRHGEVLCRFGPAPFGARSWITGDHVIAMEGDPAEGATIVRYRPDHGAAARFPLRALGLPLDLGLALATASDRLAVLHSREPTPTFWGLDVERGVLGPAVGVTTPWVGAPLLMGDQLLLSAPREGRWAEVRVDLVRGTREVVVPPGDAAQRDGYVAVPPRLAEWELAPTQAGEVGLLGPSTVEGLWQLEVDVRWRDGAEEHLPGAPTLRGRADGALWASWPAPVDGPGAAMVGRVDPAGGRMDVAVLDVPRDLPADAGWIGVVDVGDAIGTAWVVGEGEAVEIAVVGLSLR